MREAAGQRDFPLRRPKGRRPTPPEAARLKTVGTKKQKAGSPSVCRRAGGNPARRFFLAHRLSAHSLRMNAILYKNIG